MKHREEWKYIFDSYIDANSECICEIYKTCNCDGIYRVIGESVFEVFDDEDYKSIMQQLVAEYFDL